MGGSDQTRTYTFNHRSDGSPKWWPIIFKAVQLGLCILCLCVIDDPAQSFQIRLFVSGRIISLCYGTIVAYLIYSAVYLIGRFVGDEWPWRSTSILAAIAAILFFVCGVWLIKDYAYLTQRTYLQVPIVDERGSRTTPLTIALLLVSGIVLIITAVTYAVEAVLMIWIGRK